MVYLSLALRKLQFSLASFQFLTLSSQFLALWITSATQSVSKMLSVSSLDIASIKVVICIQTSKSMEIIVARTTNSPRLIYSSLSPRWWLVARRLRLVASWLVARSFRGGELVGGETPWWRSDRYFYCVRRVKETGRQL